MEICTHDIVLCIIPKEKQDELILNKTAPMPNEACEFIQQKLFTTPIVGGIQLALKSKLRYSLHELFIGNFRDN